MFSKFSGSQRLSDFQNFFYNGRLYIYIYTTAILIYPQTAGGISADIGLQYLAESGICWRKLITLFGQEFSIHQADIGLKYLVASVLPSRVLFRVAKCTI